MSQGTAASGSLRSVSEVEKSRLARLSKACLRVDWSLELENILQEVLHAAMKLRDASHAVVTLSGATGDLEQLPITSLDEPPLRSSIQSHSFHVRFRETINSITTLLTRSLVLQTSFERRAT